MAVAAPWSGKAGIQLVQADQHTRVPQVPTETQASDDTPTNQNTRRTNAAERVHLNNIQGHHHVLVDSQSSHLLDNTAASWYKQLLKHRDTKNMNIAMHQPFDENPAQLEQCPEGSSSNSYSNTEVGITAMCPDLLRHALQISCDDLHQQLYHQLQCQPS